MSTFLPRESFAAQEYLFYRRIFPLRAFRQEPTAAKQCSETDGSEVRRGDDRQRADGGASPIVIGVDAV